MAIVAFGFSAWGNLNVKLGRRRSNFSSAVEQRFTPTEQTRERKYSELKK